MAEARDRCLCCSYAPLPTDGTCGRCGWSAKLTQRRCLACGALVESGYDATALKVTALVLLGLAGVAGWLGSFPVLLAMLLAIGTVSSLIMAFTFAYRCRECSHRPSPRYMFQGEKNDVRDRRAEFYMRAGLMGAGAIAVWFGVMAVVASL